MERQVEAVAGVERLAELIRESGCAVALTGAGVSVPSGIPDFRTPETGLWAKVIERRLGQNEISGVGADDVLAEDALGLLVSFYRETERNMRATLAALQSAAEYAAETAAAVIAAGQMRAAIESWRARILG